MDSNTTGPQWQQWLEGIMATAEQELGCQECFDLLDQYVDLLVAGANPAELMPAVKQHLRHCPDCLDQVEAVLIMVRGKVEAAK